MTTNAFKNISGRSILGIIFLLFILGSISSCESRVRPKKVERILTKDSWRITSYVFQDTNIEANYINKTLGFGDDGDLIVIPYTGIKANWTTGLNKKPTLVYISGFVDPDYFYLNDDWTVTSASSSTVRMESQNGAYLNTITLTKVED